VVATGRAPDVPTGHAGQYVGLTALVVISLLAAFSLTLLPDRFIWLLGLAPLVLGIR
jgi:cadmium resistance protein CadD (predicted permease)